MKGKVYAKGRMEGGREGDAVEREGCERVASPSGLRKGPSCRDERDQWEEDFEREGEKEGK